tara:strand:+ start:1156 stop:1644 length:489 start_codon:yes stop_codon:yes gene_type:complete
MFVPKLKQRYPHSVYAIREDYVLSAIYVCAERLSLPEDLPKHHPYFFEDVDYLSEDALSQYGSLDVDNLSHIAVHVYTHLLQEIATEGDNVSTPSDNHRLEDVFNTSVEEFLAQDDKLVEGVDYKELTTDMVKKVMKAAAKEMNIKPVQVDNRRYIFRRAIF